MGAYRFSEKGDIHEAESKVKIPIVVYNNKVCTMYKSRNS